MATSQQQIAQEEEILMVENEEEILLVESEEPAAKKPKLEAEEIVLMDQNKPTPTVESEELAANKPKVEYLWKLVKQKYILTFRLCHGILFWWIFVGKFFCWKN